MVKIKNFTPRGYQESILKTCKQNNTLVCLPTGTGKTKIAIILAVERLSILPNTRIIICSPTKPLVNQIKEEFRASTDLDPITINSLTGATSPQERKEIWKRSTIIVATPQTIENDIVKGRIMVNDVSLLCIDECHRSKMRFANTTVAQIYFQQATHPKVLALTASPGSTKESLKEVCDNLNIDSIEIRTEDDEDMREHIQGKEIEFIKVDLPPEFVEIKTLLKKAYDEKVKTLRKFGATKPAGLINKRDLLGMQRILQTQIRQGNRAAFVGISLVAQAIKLSYALELVETQTIKAAKDYLKKLEGETSKAAKTILAKPEVKEAILRINALHEKEAKHPKLKKALELIQKEVTANNTCKLIVFANYRNTVDEIVSLLRDNSIEAKKFVGQANKGGKGLKQKEQVALLEEFKEGLFNVLVASSVGEEGLDIPEVNAVIFYEPVASELRRVQRSGRTGRTKPGKIVYLVTKNTRDEAYHWASQRKQKKMNEMLYKIKEKQSTL